MADRFFKIKLVQEGTGKVVEVHVNQVQFVPQYTFSVSDGTVRLDSNGGTHTLSITSTKTVVGGGSSTVGYSSKVTGNGARYVSVQNNKITVKPNDTFTEQNATITFTQAESNKQLIVKVVMAKLPDEKVFNVVPSSLQFTPEFGSKQVVVESTYNRQPRAWKIENESQLPNWLKVSAESKAGGKNNLTIRVDPYGA